MSDPVTNVEVEDVLSSIRRLVSDDKRPTSLAETAPSSDRLVLTPALRVAEQGDESHNDDEQAIVEEKAWSDFGTSPDRAAETQADVEEAESFELEKSEEEPEVADLSGEQDDAEIASIEGDESAPEPLLLETQVEPEAEVEAPFIDVPEDESAEDNDVTVAELVPEQGEAAFFAKSAASLSAKIAALETVIGKTDEQWEPDDTGKSDYSGTEAPAMDWEAEPAEAEVEETTTAEHNADEAEAETLLGQAGDDILDEETLRDLVSDIVREELQGALGERITRNVRKLVRREIHRALAAQDLE